MACCARLDEDPLCDTREAAGGGEGAPRAMVDSRGGGDVGVGTTAGIFLVSEVMYVQVDVRQSWNAGDNCITENSSAAV
jgi:hypothetical protein